jgi:hypothetical protein
MSARKYNAADKTPVLKNGIFWNNNLFWLLTGNFSEKPQISRTGLELDQL